MVRDLKSNKFVHCVALPFGGQRYVPGPDGRTLLSNNARTILLGARGRTEKQIDPTGRNPCLRFLRRWYPRQIPGSAFNTPWIYGPECAVSVSVLLPGGEPLVNELLVDQNAQDQKPDGRHGTRPRNVYNQFSPQDSTLDRHFSFSMITT